jgi:activator of Hsp90 ATPase-like protein
MTAMETTTPPTTAAVRKSITVQADPQRAFDVFTAEFDLWWPRTHHIGKAPMKKAIVECRAGGRLYSEQVDGTECDWGTVLVWEPPHRFVWAWQINGQWQFEPDLAKSSEVEVRFTAEAGGRTRVDLEHWHLERHGMDAAAVRTAIDSPKGWGALLQLFAEEAERSA